MKEIEEITKRKATKTDKAGLIEFKRVINQPPPKSLIRDNKEYNSKSLPIQVIEQMLSALYLAYQIELPHQPVLIEGQIMTTVNVKVLHPVLKEWLTYSGTSCVPLIAADNKNMKYNHANISAGKSYAIVNAVKSIGQIFRAEKDNYADVMKDYFKKKSDSEDPNKVEIGRMMKMIDACTKDVHLARLKDKVDSLNSVDLTSRYMNKYVKLITDKTK